MGQSCRKLSTRERKTNERTKKKKKKHKVLIYVKTVNMGKLRSISKFFRLIRVVVFAVRSNKRKSLEGGPVSIVPGNRVVDTRYVNRCFRSVKVYHGTLHVWVTSFRVCKSHCDPK